MNKFIHRFSLILSISCLLSFNLFAQNMAVPDRPTPARLVNDFTGKFFSAQEKASLEKKLADYESETSVQIAVVVVPKFRGDRAEFADDIGEKWGVGQKGFDNGIVILVDPYDVAGQRDIHIATGYGVEAAVPDVIANRIVQEEIIPKFKQGRFYDGISRATDKLKGYLTGEFSAANDLNPSRFDGNEEFGIPPIVM